VPSDGYRVPIGKANVARVGKDVTIISHSYMLLESIRCAEVLESNGISVEVVDLRTIRPIDTETILCSVSKTRRVVVADNGWVKFGVSAEIISVITENIFDKLLSAPVRIGMNDSPSPSTRALANNFYPRADNIAKIISEMLSIDLDMNVLFPKSDIPLDVPDPSFTGPF
jgi:pyruvate dehydrogenase E1 component beta subunit